MSKKGIEEAKGVFAGMNKKPKDEIENEPITALTNKYIVLKRKDIHNIEKHNDTTNSFVFIFKDSKDIKEFKKESKYFVVKIDDEFSNGDIIDNLNLFYNNKEESDESCR